MKIPSAFNRRLFHIEEVVAKKIKKREDAAHTEFMSKLARVFSLEEVNEIVAIVRRDGEKAWTESLEKQDAALFEKVVTVYAPMAKRYREEQTHGRMTLQGQNRS